MTGLALTAGPVQAAHVGCDQHITESITLDRDVGPCPGMGLHVTANNITIDLNGHSIFGANGPGDHAGIHLMDVTGVTVKNGTVKGFDAGIWIETGGANTVSDVTAENNYNDQLAPPCDFGEGVTIWDSSDNRILDSQVSNNGPYGGVSVVGDSDRNVIFNNVASGNNIISRSGSGCDQTSHQGEGIRIVGPGAEDNRIENNLVENNLLAGIGLHGWVCGESNPAFNEAPNRGTVIVGNKVKDTRGTSISAGITFRPRTPDPEGVVCPAFGSSVDRNSSTGNQADGIFVARNSHDNVISRNVVNGNGYSGIYLDDPAYGNRFTNVGPTLLDLTTPDRPPYTEGTDYRVMSGSGSGDVTAKLVPVDITLAPGATGANNPQDPETSNSGCEQADYTAAGFTAGDVALIQRGTCTFVSKVALAVQNGASAVVMFNEGQSPSRTTFAFGAVGPQTIPVITVSYAVGFDLYSLTQAGVPTIHVITNTTNEPFLTSPAPYNNTLKYNRGLANGEVDGYDGNLDRPCDNNKWFQNRFGAINQNCVAAGGGTGWVGGPGGGNTRPDTPPGLARNAALER